MGFQVTSKEITHDAVPSLQPSIEILTQHSLLANDFVPFYLGSSQMSWRFCWGYCCYTLNSIRALIPFITNYLVWVAVKQGLDVIGFTTIDCDVTFRCWGWRRERKSPASPRVQNLIFDTIVFMLLWVPGFCCREGWDRRMWGQEHRIDDDQCIRKRGNIAFKELIVTGERYWALRTGAILRAVFAIVSWMVVGERPARTAKWSLVW